MKQFHLRDEKNVVVPTKIFSIVLTGIKHFKIHIFERCISLFLSPFYNFLLFSSSFFLLSLYFSSFSAFFNFLSFFSNFFFILFPLSAHILLSFFPSFLYSIFLLFLPFFFSLFLLFKKKSFFTSFFSFVVINSILMELSAVEPHYPNRPRLTKYVKLGQKPG